MQLQKHGLRTPGEEIAFTERPKIHSHSQIFRYGRSIFCLPHWPKFLWFMPSLGVRSPCLKQLNFQMRLLIMDHSVYRRVEELRNLKIMMMYVISLWRSLFVTKVLLEQKNGCSFLPVRHMVESIVEFSLRYYIVITFYEIFKKSQRMKIHELSGLIIRIFCNPSYFLISHYFLTSHARKSYCVRVRSEYPNILFILYKAIGIF